MLEVLEKINDFSLEDRALLLFKLQESMEHYDGDYTDIQKKELDERMQEHLNKTDTVFSFSEVLDGMEKINVPEL